MTDDEAAALREKAHAAPWEKDGVLLIRQPDDALSIGMLLSGEAASKASAQANTDLILAASPAVVLSLLAEREALRAALQQVAQEVGWIAEKSRSVGVSGQLQSVANAARAALSGSAAP